MGDDVSDTVHCSRRGPGAAVVELHAVFGHGFGPGRRGADGCGRDTNTGPYGDTGPSNAHSHPTPLDIWCGTNAPLIQEAATDALSILSIEPLIFEQRFRLLLTRLEQAEINPPAELGLSLGTAREGFDDLVQLLDAAEWDTGNARGTALDRADARFMGAFKAVHSLTLQQCPGSNGLLVEPGDGPVDWCTSRVLPLTFAALQAVTFSPSPTQRAINYRSLLEQLRESQDTAPESLAVTVVFAIDRLDSYLDFLDEVALQNEVSDASEDATQDSGRLLFEEAELAQELEELLGRLNEFAEFGCGLETNLNFQSGIFAQELERQIIENAEPEMLALDVPEATLEGEVIEPMPTSVVLFTDDVFAELVAAGLTDDQARCIADSLDGFTADDLTAVTSGLFDDCALDRNELIEVLLALGSAQ